jgi:hypothetical protein
LVVAARISKLNASLTTARGWSTLPVPESDEVIEFMMDDTLGPLMDVDQPIDIAVAVAGKGLRMRTRIAVSAALKDVDRAKAALSERYKLVPGDNGSLLIQEAGRAALSVDDHEDGTSEDEDAVPGTGHGDRGEGDRHPCELAPAYGKSATRLVCGWSPRALSELAPWLTRTATRLATDSDLHVELRMEPLRATIAAQKRLLGGMLASGLGGRVDLSGSRQLIASVVADMIDFSLDLDRALLDVQLNERAATAVLAFTLSRTTSALARLATAHAERNASPPAAFWQLPGDADFALFERGIDEAELARGRELLLRAVDETLADDGLKDADRKPILDALGKLISPAPLVYASGLDVDAARKAITAEWSRPDLSDPVAFGEAERVSAEALLGWRIMEWDEPAGRWMAAVKDLATALGKPAVVAAYRANGKPAPPAALRPAPMPKGLTLPAGTLHYVLELQPFHSLRPASGGAGAKPMPPARPSKPVAVHIVVVPDGERTWLAVGGGDPITSKLALAMGLTGDKLAARVELAPLKAARAGTAGFVSLRGLPEGAWQLSPMLRGKVLDEVAKLPTAGTVPVTFSLTPSSERIGQVTARLEMPRGAIKDIATLTLHGF